MELPAGVRGGAAPCVVRVWPLFGVGVALAVGVFGGWPLAMTAGWLLASVLAVPLLLADGVVLFCLLA